MICFSCFSDMAESRRDKRGRPYIICKGCGTRMFSMSERAAPALSFVSTIFKHMGVEKLNVVIVGLVAELRKQDPRLIGLIGTKEAEKIKDAITKKEPAK